MAGYRFSSAPAVAAPAAMLDPANASPVLRAAARALGDAHDRLKQTPSSFDAADRLPEEWRRSNPEPMGRRANKRWNLPRVGDLSRCRVGKRCSPRIHDALMAVAMIKPETWVSYA
jgi:hypothetical protein